MELETSKTMDRILDELGEPRNLDRTQVLRRAILLLAFLDGEVEAGKEVIIYNSKTGTADKLLIEGEIE